MKRSPRVMQAEGIFDLPARDVSEITWDVALPLEAREWNIGLIVGPSGSGKSTVLTELFGCTTSSGASWSDASILDDFPPDMGIKEIIGLLSSVGFSAPPSWLRPYHALSNGEQFRVGVARALASGADIIVLDEFTSVVDRTVAQIGSAAVAKTVRKRAQKMVVASCHYDVIDWLQPDWLYEPGTNAFTWRDLRRRPAIRLEISRCNREAWHIFKRHHYLSSDLHPGATCFIATVCGCPAAFTAVLSHPHAIRPGWREHRTVCLPDFQGVGIGNAMSEYVAALFRASKPYFSATSNPAMIYHRAKSKMWRMSHPPRRNSKHQGGAGTAATDRLTAGFEYLGPPRADEARAFGLAAAAHRTG